MTEPKDAREDLAIDVETIKDLWSRTYNTAGKPDWSHLLPYYDDEIHFRDSIQDIHGIEEFRAMTERLAGRSKDLKMRVVRAVQRERTIFLEWEMTIGFKKYPNSVLFGASRLTIGESGKIVEQRDYYDLQRFHFEDFQEI